MNEIIKDILEKIEMRGYVSYIVGGYVRDYLVGKESLDVDIATNALPEVLKDIFPDGELHPYGGIHLEKDGFMFAITTFRKELIYEKRKPVKIEYVNELEIDLQRRDFTINAICMDKEGNVLNPLNGIRDLKEKRICFIGDVDTKLRDDPLRILRAVRFATVLDFEIEESLYENLKKYAYLVKDISKYRVRCEYQKILASKNFQKGLDLSQEIGLNSVLNIEYKNVYFSSNIYEMWAQVKIKDISFTKQEKRTIIKMEEMIKR